MWAKLSNNDLIGFDFAIEATGVQPNTAIWSTHCPLV